MRSFRNTSDVANTFSDNAAGSPRRAPTVSPPARGIFIAITLTCVSFTHAEDWPNWRGPQRNDITNEPSGFDGKTWPLKEAWQTNVGDGSTSPIIVADRVFTMGHQKGRDRVVCLDAATGKPLCSVDYASLRRFMTTSW